MKCARIGLAATIMMMASVSFAVAQDRESDRGSSDRSQNESWQGNREQGGRQQAYGERGGETGSGRGHSDAGQPGDNEIGVMGDDQFVRFRFARGRARFEIRCPANEQMRDCLQAGSEFIKQASQIPDSVDTRAGEISKQPGLSPSMRQE